MAKVRRTKNIFNQNIANESLFQTDGQGQYKIGSLEIKSDWLKGTPPDQYIKNIYSSLKIAQLRHQLQKLKDEASAAIIQDDGEISSPTKANLFKMTILKKKIMDFQLDNTGDTNKIQKTIQSNKKFKIAEAPNTDDMLIQKITTGSISFFQKPITRKVTLKEKCLIVESKKNQQKIDQWTKINLDEYHIEIDHKQKKTKNKSQFDQSAFNKNKTLSNIVQTFLGFEWVQGYDVRLLLSKQNQRPYCLYLKEENVQKLLKYLKFYNFENTLVKNKSSAFSGLSDQLFQKVFTLFNNKLRMYDFKIKQKPDRTSPVESPNKNLLSPSNQKIEINFSSPKKSVKFSEDKENKTEDQLLAEDLQKALALKKTQSSMVRDQNVSEIIFSPQIRRQSISQYGNMSLFKLRTKKVTVNYDDLQDADLNIIQMQKQKDKDKDKHSQKQIESPRMSPIRETENYHQFKVFDFKLDLKEQGMSEADENESSRSMIQNRKRVTNLNVSTNIFNQINEKDFKDEQDGGDNNFNINIHEIESDSQNNRDDDRLKSSGPFFLNYEDEGSFNQSGHFTQRKNSDSSMSSLRLEEIDDRIESDRYHSEPKNISPRSFHSSSSSAKQNGKMRLCLRERQPNMKGACYSIQMLYPYHKQKMKIHILQVDPQIQMQKYQVVCSQSQFNFVQKPECSPRYSIFEPTNQNSTFNLIRESNSFIFILKEQSSQSFYSYFQVDMKEIRYQRDMSQLILISEDDLLNTASQKSPRAFSMNKSFAKSFSSQSHVNRQISSPQNKNSYKFAAIVKLYFSPNEIQIWPQMSTVQFLSKYISMTIYDPHYDFKYNFVDKKKRYYQLKDQVNKRCVRAILKNGMGKENKDMKQIAFSGLPQQVVSIIQKKLQKDEKISKEKIWGLINFHSSMLTMQLKLLQESIVPPNLRIVKVMLKPLQLINTLLNFHFYNKALLKRIYEISIFFLQQNPFTNILQNFIIAICKEILSKLENVLIRTKNQEQVKAIIKIYLQVQYQVDQLFQQVRKYFV